MKVYTCYVFCYPAKQKMYTVSELCQELLVLELIMIVHALYMEKQICWENLA